MSDRLDPAAARARDVLVEAVADVDRVRRPRRRPAPAPARRSPARACARRPRPRSRSPSSSGARPSALEHLVQRDVPVADHHQRAARRRARAIERRTDVAGTREAQRGQQRLDERVELEPASAPSGSAARSDLGAAPAERAQARPRRGPRRGGRGSRRSRRRSPGRPRPRHLDAEPSRQLVAEQGRRRRARPACRGRRAGWRLVRGGCGHGAARSRRGEPARVGQRTGASLAAARPVRGIEPVAADGAACTGRLRGAWPAVAGARDRRTERACHSYTGASVLGADSAPCAPTTGRRSPAIHEPTRTTAPPPAQPRTSRSDACW